MFHNPLASGREDSKTLLDPPYVSRVPPLQANQSASLTTSAVLDLLWRGRFWISFGALLGLFCGIAFLVVATPRYTASSQLLINPQDLRLVDNSVTAPSQQSEANLAEVESQVRVLVSQKVLGQVVDKLDLTHDPEFVHHSSQLMTAVKDMVSTLGLHPAPEANNPAVSAQRVLANIVSARREDRTYVVDLAVTTAEPEKSVAIADAIVEAYLQSQGQTRTALADRATRELSGRLDDLKAKVRDAEDRVEDYKSKNGISSTRGPNGILTDQQLGEMSTQLVAARARTDAAKSRFDQIRSALTKSTDIGALTEAVQSPTISGLRLQYAEIVRREAELMGQLGARHPSVIDIKAQDLQLKNLIAAEVRRLAASAQGDYQRALSSQIALSKAVDLQEARNHSTDQSLVHLRELERDVEASRTVYQSFLVRSQETGQEGRLNSANVSVISDAAFPEKGFPPKPWIILLVTGLLGAGAGGCLAALLMPTPVGRGRLREGSEWAA